MPLTIGEIVIRHLLMDSPDNRMHVTPDGQKLYFLVDPGQRLEHVDVPDGLSFNDMSDDDLNRYFQKILNQRMDAL
jgi:hypothetical protein